MAGKVLLVVVRLLLNLSMPFAYSVMPRAKMCHSCWIVEGGERERFVYLSFINCQL